MLQQPVEFYIHTGDVAYNDGTYAQIETRVFGIYRDLFNGVYFNPSLGNHDYHTESGRPYLDSYILPEEAFRASDDKRYYSFDWGNAHFVALDSNDPLDETDANASDDMFDWLRNDLQSANDRGLFWKFVYHHHPAFSSSTLHGSDTQVQNKLVPIYEQYGVDLVLNGHDHTYERTCPIDLQQCTTVSQGGVTYIVTGGGGALLYDNGLPEWFTAYADSLFHFVKVDVQGCTLQTQGITASGTVFDPHVIDRCTPPSNSPVANNVSDTTAEDTPLTVTLTARDPEECQLTFSIVSGPANGTLSAISDADCTPGTPNVDSASVIYTPNADFNGTDSFAYKANDGASDSNIAIVFITVNAMNDTPVAVTGIDPNTMPRGTTMEATITGSGFVAGAGVSFENGNGPAPAVSKVDVAPDGKSLTATVTAKSGGSPRNRVWDVRVTNPDSSSGVLVDGFTVTAQ